MHNTRPKSNPAGPPCGSAARISPAGIAHISMFMIVQIAVYCIITQNSSNNQSCTWYWYWYLYLHAKYWYLYWYLNL